MKKLYLSDLHKSIGGKMINFSGYYMPVQYEGVKAEHNTIRNEVGVFDVSHMGEVFITGDKSLDFLQYITSNDVSKLIPGKVQYTCFPNSTGGIVDDFLLYMITENNYLLVVTSVYYQTTIYIVNNFQPLFALPIILEIAVKNNSIKFYYLSLLLLYSCKYYLKLDPQLKYRTFDH